jgi:hypothetical protein
MAESVPFLGVIKTSQVVGIVSLPSFYPTSREPNPRLGGNNRFGAAGTGMCDLGHGNIGDRGAVAIEQVQLCHSVSDLEGNTARADLISGCYVLFKQFKYPTPLAERVIPFVVGRIPLAIICTPGNARLTYHLTRTTACRD